MQKTSRLAILNWVKSKVTEQHTNNQRTPYEEMKQQLVKLIEDLDAEIAEEMLHAEQKETLSFELFKTYTLLYYCAELLTEKALYESKSSRLKTDRLFNELAGLLNDAMYSMVKQYSKFFSIEDLPVNKKELRVCIDNLLPLIRDIGIELKQHYGLTAANLLYSQLIQVCLQQTVSYHTLSYIRWVLQYLKNYFETDSEKPGEWSYLFILINFNTPEVLTQSCNSIEYLIHKYDTEAEKIEAVKQLQYHIRNIATEKDKILCPQNNSVKQHVLEMLEEYKVLFEHAAGEQRLPLRAKDEIPGKICTSFSVEQLAAFIRVLKDEKILTETNTNLLCKQVISMFKTEKTEEIAFNSFQSKFYKVERRTLQTMKDLFIHLHNKSRMMQA